MRYWDASALVPLIIEEPSTELVHGWLEKDVRYLLATRGEPGIDSVPPNETGPFCVHQGKNPVRSVGLPGIIGTEP